MDNAAAYQSQIIARQRLTEAARVARQYTSRRPAPETITHSPRVRQVRVGWWHPARAGFQRS